MFEREVEMAFTPECVPALSTNCWNQSTSLWLWKFCVSTTVVVTLLGLRCMDLHSDIEAGADEAKDQ